MHMCKYTVPRTQYLHVARSQEPHFRADSASHKVETRAPPSSPLLSCFSSNHISQLVPFAIRLCRSVFFRPRLLSNHHRSWPLLSSFRLPNHTTPRNADPLSSKRFVGASQLSFASYEPEPLPSELPRDAFCLHSRPSSSTISAVSCWFGSVIYEFTSRESFGVIAFAAQSLLDRF